jgi:hypothetical protein
MGVDRSGFNKALKKLYDDLDRYSAGATIAADAATGVLTFSGVAQNNETVTIGGQTYTFKTALTSAEAANEVLIGADQDASLTNLTNAVNGGAGAGTTYGSATPVNAMVTGVADTGANTLTVTAKKAGAAGNAIATTETMANGAWEFATLNGGGSITVKDVGAGAVRTLLFTLDNLHVKLTDEAAVVAYGSKKIYDFAQSSIQGLSATANLTATKVSKSDTEIIAAWDGDFGLGSAAAGNNAALATTEQDFIPTTATPQATAGATTAKGRSTAVGPNLDGTTTPADLYLNVLVDDADQNIGTTNAWIKFSGTIKVVYVEGGDY